MKAKSEACIQACRDHSKEEKDMQKLHCNVLDKHMTRGSRCGPKS